MTHITEKAGVNCQVKKVKAILGVECLVLKKFLDTELNSAQIATTKYKNFVQNFVLIFVQNCIPVKIKLTNLTMVKKSYGNAI